MERQRRIDTETYVYRNVNLPQQQLARLPMYVRVEFAFLDATLIKLREAALVDGGSA